METNTAVKLLSLTEDTATIGGFGVVFGGRDIVGDTFTPETDFRLDYVPSKEVYYDHALGEIKTPLGLVFRTEIRDLGVWVEAQLRRSQEYVAEVLKLIEQGVLGWSSGSIAHLVQRNGNMIKSWPIVEFSLTPTPAEPRTLGVQRIKTLADSDPRLKAFLPEEPGNGSADATATDEPPTLTPTPLKVKMTDNTQPVGQQPDIAKLLEIFAARVEARLDATDKELQAIKAQPVSDPGTAVKAPAVTRFHNTRRFDGMAPNDIGMMIDLLRAGKQPVSEDAFKAYAVRTLDAYQTGDRSAPVQSAVKAMAAVGIPGDAIKANELNYSTQANYGDEWVGVSYSTSLWESIRETSAVFNRIPSVEIPQGYESMIIPLESGDPTFYLVSQATAQDSNPGPITRTVTTSKLGTAKQTLTLGKLGAGVNYTGELVEDSLINWVAQLRRQLEAKAAATLEHVVIDGDTATGAMTNINDIGGTPGGSEAFLLLNGFRKLALVTNTANSRSGTTIAESDYLDTVKLMGLAGTNAVNRGSVAFITDLWTWWKTLDLSVFKTRDVYSRPTLEGGLVSTPWGYELLFSPQMHYANQDATYGLKANTAGKVDLDTASNNTTGSILAVRWDQWLVGWKRRITFETVRVPHADATEVTAMLRLGMINRDNEASAISYNLTL